jgi:hypothetical protein
MVSVLPMRTVLKEIKNILPQGTNFGLPTGLGKAYIPDWSLPPPLPTDLFAVAAHLMRVSGLIGWFDPSPTLRDTAEVPRLPDTRRGELLEAARAWRELGRRDEVNRLWSILVTDLPDEREKNVLRPRMQSKRGNMGWCQAALELLVIADEAAGELNRSQVDTFMENVIRALNRPDNRAKKRSKKIAGSTLARRERHPPSLTLQVDTDVACVQPKGRIAQVGCTLRGLSKNLALLPSRASVRAQWAEPDGELQAEQNGTLDILLIPLPYRIEATSFKTPAATGHGPWDNFHLEQSWLAKPKTKPNPIVALTSKLIEAAQKQTPKLSGLIFPEYALDWETFDKVCAYIHKAHPSIEFVIAGSSINCDGEPGNHLLTAVRQEYNSRFEFAAISRRKHHRWRLTPDQVRTYGLAPVLNPGVDAWWESHDVLTPELYFHRFRKSSTFVAMICEDLARSDPCHEILRSVGPNIVFALLMDGPQLPTRWGARYASSLADDPGSSVLTFTSWGMIKRANDTAPPRASRTVAMWKDDSGDIHEIPMPAVDRDSGILLSIAAKEVTERTIDGRKAKNWSWRFNGQFPVTL